MKNIVLGNTGIVTPQNAFGDLPVQRVDMATAVKLLRKNLADYKESSLFAMSALGCETKEEMDGAQKVVKAVGPVRPMRIEDPVLWMVMKYMQERGWLE